MVDNLSKFEKKIKIEDSKNKNNKPKMAFTFDDGPSEFTNEILDILKQYNANATFFVLGQRVKDYPNILKRIVADGNEIGNHTYSHINLKEAPLETILFEINEAKNAIKEVCGVTPTLFRPTYGYIKSAHKSYVNLPLINWTIDTIDWGENKPYVDVMSDIIINSAKAGNIILMHDVYPNTVLAFKDAIDTLSTEYDFVTVSELFSFYGKKLKPGVTYLACK